MSTSYKEDAVLPKYHEAVSLSQQKEWEDKLNLQDTDIRTPTHHCTDVIDTVSGSVTGVCYINPVFPTTAQTTQQVSLLHSFHI